MRYFRSPLASSHCPGKQSYHVQEGKGLQGQGNRNCPHGYPPPHTLAPGETARGWEQMPCEKQSQTSSEASPSNTQQDPRPQSGNSMLFLNTHNFPPTLSSNKICAKSEQGALSCEALSCRAHSDSTWPKCQALTRKAPISLSNTSP